MKHFTFIFLIFLISACATQTPKREPASAPSFNCAEAATSFISQLTTKSRVSRAPPIRPKFEFVNSVDDFYMHMFNHVNNVGKIADDIFTEIDKNPEQWRTVFQIPKDVQIDEGLRTTLKKFIQNHDASKINIESEFLAMINRKKLIIYELYSIYGKNFKDLSADDQKIIQVLNDLDKMVHDKFIAENSLPEWKVKFIDEIEKQADGIERGSNPVTAEEMTKKTWMESEGIQRSIKKKLVDGFASVEITRLNKKLELTLMIENRYNDITTSYLFYKDKIKFLERALIENNFQTENLKQFSLNHLLVEFEKVEGEILNIDDPKWIESIQKFFFSNGKGKIILERAKKAPMT